MKKKHTFGTAGPLAVRELRALLKYKRRNADDEEWATFSVSELLELPGLDGRIIAIATTAGFVTEDVAVAIDTCACVTDTVIALCVETKFFFK